MVRAAIRLGVFSAIFAGILANTVSASAQDWKANHGVKPTVSSHVGESGNHRRMIQMKFPR